MVSLFIVFKPNPLDSGRALTIGDELRAGDLVVNEFARRRRVRFRLKSPNQKRHRTLRNTKQYYKFYSEEFWLDVMEVGSIEDVAVARVVNSHIAMAIYDTSTRERSDLTRWPLILSSFAMVIVTGFEI